MKFLPDQSVGAYEHHHLRTFASDYHPLGSFLIGNTQSQIENGKIIPLVRSTAET